MVACNNNVHDAPHLGYPPPLYKLRACPSCSRHRDLCIHSVALRRILVCTKPAARKCSLASTSKSCAALLCTRTSSQTTPPLLPIMVALFYGE